MIRSQSYADIFLLTALMCWFVMTKLWTITAWILLVTKLGMTSFYRNNRMASAVTFKNNKLKRMTKIFMKSYKPKEKFQHHLFHWFHLKWQTIQIIWQKRKKIWMMKLRCRLIGLKIDVPQATVAPEIFWCYLIHAKQLLHVLVSRIPCMIKKCRRSV